MFNIPIVTSKLSYLVDPTTQEPEFSPTNYWESYQSRIKNLSYADAIVRLWKPDSIQHVSGTEQIKEDDPSLYSCYTYVPSLLDIYEIIDHAKSITNAWDTIQSQIENLSYKNANFRRVGETVRIKEDIQGAFSHNTRVTLLSNVDVVLDLADTGSNYRETRQRQVENLGHVASDSAFPEHNLFQPINEAVEIKEYPHGSYLHSTIIVPQSDTDVVFTLTEVGTAITHFTQLHKHQIEKQTFEISEQFDILSQREDNWDERGSLKPTKLTLAHAREVIDAYINTVTSAGYQCNTPTISSDGDGDVTAAWYKGERQIHFQISEHEVDYFKVWGTNIDTEMEVDFLIPDNYLTLWEWLIDE